MALAAELKLGLDFQIGPQGLGGVDGVTTRAGHVANFMRTPLPVGPLSLGMALEAHRVLSKRRLR